jgi:multimeric flavodoxin WrbA
MKVLALNSSPHKEKGNTALILNPFLDGMKDAGAEVEIFYVHDLKVHPCLADHTCQLKAPGKCVQDDDMRWLLPKILQADILVWASPLYTDGVTSTMKMVMDRVLPGAQPFLEIRNGRLRHILVDGTRSKKFVLVSNCGFWEMENFDPLLAHMKAFCGTVGVEYSGAVLRPHGPILKGMLAKGAQVTDVLEAAKEAGRQLASDGEMSEETLRTISRPLLSRDAFLQLSNKFAWEATKKDSKPT